MKHLIYCVIPLVLLVVLGANVASSQDYRERLRQMTIQDKQNLLARSEQDLANAQASLQRWESAVGAGNRHFFTFICNAGEDIGVCLNRCRNVSQGMCTTGHVGGVTTVLAYVTKGSLPYVTRYNGQVDADFRKYLVAQGGALDRKRWEVNNLRNLIAILRQELGLPPVAGSGGSGGSGNST